MILAEWPESEESIPMIVSYPNRRFQIWEYRISHGFLLIRSPRNASVETNADIFASPFGPLTSG